MPRTRKLAAAVAAGGSSNRVRKAAIPVVKEEEEKEEDRLAFVKNRISMYVRSGFYTDDEVLENAMQTAKVELGDKTVEPAMEEAVRRLVDAAVAEQAAREESWGTDKTDCDRLDQAFVALEAEGILAQQNYTCCQTCGTAEIHDQMALAAAAGRQIKGYVFYHQQDTEFAADGSGVCLTYGGYFPATKEDEDDSSDENDGKEEDEWEDVDEEEIKAERTRAAVAIGRRVVSALKAAGLKVKWNGDLNKRIEVSLDWRRRRAALAQRPAAAETVPVARAA